MNESFATFLNKIDFFTSKSFCQKTITHTVASKSSYFAWRVVYCVIKMSMFLDIEFSPEKAHKMSLLEHRLVACLPVIAFRIVSFWFDLLFMQILPTFWIESNIFVEVEMENKQSVMACEYS